MKTNIIPKGWEEVKLGNHVDIFNGGAFSSLDAAEYGAKWVKIANVGIGEIKWNEKSFLPKTFLEEYKKYKLNIGDVILALTRPTLGEKLKVAEIKENDKDSLMNQRVGKIVRSDKLNQKFIYYFLRIRRLAYQINQQLTGSDPPNLSSKAFNYITLLLPPLAEQERIVAVLETWDKALELLERKIELKQQVKRGLMQQLLTGKQRLPTYRNAPKWKTVKLGDVCEVKKGTSFTKKELVEGNVPVIAGGQQPACYHKYSNREGKIITVSASGAYAGYIDYYEIPIFASDCSTIQKKTANINFIYAILQSKQNWIYHALQTGGAQPHVYPKDLVKLKITIPQSLEEQSAIASILTTADEEIEALQAKRALLLSQKQFLLNQLITGELRTPENLMMFG